MFMFQLSGVYEKRCARASIKGSFFMGCAVPVPGIAGVVVLNADASSGNP